MNIDRQGSGKGGATKGPHGPEPKRATTLPFRGGGQLTPAPPHARQSHWKQRETGSVGGVPAVSGDTCPPRRPRREHPFPLATPGWDCVGGSPEHSSRRIARRGHGRRPVSRRRGRRHLVSGWRPAQSRGQPFASGGTPCLGNHAPLWAFAVRAGFSRLSYAPMIPTAVPGPPNVPHAWCDRAKLLSERLRGTRPGRG